MIGAVAQHIESCACYASTMSDGATTDAIYAWARRSGHGQVIAVKGVAGFDRSTPVDGPTFAAISAV